MEVKGELNMMTPVSHRSVPNEIVLRMRKVKYYVQLLSDVLSLPLHIY